MIYSKRKIKTFDIEAKHEHDFRRSILIVDDEPVNLRIVGNILGEDYDIIYAQTGQEAMDTLATHKGFVALILLDIYMPNMTGYQVIDKIKAEPDYNKIPIIVFTSDKDAEVESLQHGAVDFLNKPFDRPEVIRARVRRAIELSIDRNIIRNTVADQLTGLLTKEYFFEYAREYDKFHPEDQVDAIVLNFNKFHLINELYGRSFGDKILCAIADVVRDIARSCGGVASRYNADLFYLYIEHQEEYEFLVKKLSESLSCIMKAPDIRIRIGIYPDLFHAVSVEERFDRALQACNTLAKHGYTTKYAVYDSTMHEKELYEAKLLEELNSAISQRQLSLVFQPKYDIKGDEPKLCSAEVLVRWNHPVFGSVKPDFFIPLFEGNGQIKELDRYVWSEAAKHVRIWRDIYNMTIPVSVNVSRVDIFDPDLLEFLNKIVEENGINPSDLHLEITETAYTDSTTQIIKVVKELQDAGFMVEMDDFGKGYSSLNMLTSLPIDALKLDMAFIKDIAEDSREMSIVEFILDIARFLGVPVIAEGVETSSQYLLLKKAGCDIIQGYYFSKPVNASEFGQLIERSHFRKRSKGE